MSLIRNLLALIGVLAILVSGVCYLKFQETMGGFDAGARAVYTDMVSDLLKTKNSAEATTWKYKVAEGLSPDDVEESMKFIANEHNMSLVGELPIAKDIEAKTGKPYRYAKIFMFCNSLTAAAMMDYSDAFSAFLPCRISMVEDKTGQLWLYTMNMDMMIYGGSPLPADLKEKAIEVKTIIQDIISRGAAGDF